MLSFSCPVSPADRARGVFVIRLSFLLIIHKYYTGVCPEMRYFVQYLPLEITG